jgi:hypothetical protein
MKITEKIKKNIIYTDCITNRVFIVYVFKLIWEALIDCDLPTEGNLSYLTWIGLTVLIEVQ